jgi:hypothetical protein
MFWFNRKKFVGSYARRSAVRSEWGLLTATHNLLKLHQHRLAAI